MASELEYLPYEKFICNGCGTEVKAVDFENVIKHDKLCCECALNEITGGFKPRPKNKKVFKKHAPITSLRREIGKKRKKKEETQEQLAKERADYDAKWDRIRAGYRGLIQGDEE